MIETLHDIVDEFIENTYVSNGFSGRFLNNQHVVLKKG